MREGKLCRSVFFRFLFQTLASGKSGSVTLGNAEAYLKTEFKSVGSKSGWGSYATLVIFCRWPKYIWKNENGATKSKWWISEGSVSNGQITGVYLGKSAWQVKLGLPSLWLKECSEFVSFNTCAMSFPVKWSGNGWENLANFVLHSGL